MGLREEMIAAYGGACACCGETRPLFLTAGHINNDGAAHRKSLTGANRGGQPFWKKLKAQGWPPGLLVLCWNCNTGASFNYGICPHRRNHELHLHSTAP